MEKKTPYIGRLDTKVTLYKTDVERNSVGERKPTLVQVCETYASTENETGFLDVDEKVHHVVDSTFIIRKRPDLLGVANLSLVTGNMKYRVIHIEPIRRSHLLIKCVDPDAWTVPSGDNGGGNPGGGSVPVITNQSEIRASAGMVFSLQISTTGQVTEYDAVGLPEGLSIDQSTGLISGVLDEFIGIRNISLRASNQNGQATKLIFLHTVGYDVSILMPPQNVHVVEYHLENFPGAFLLGFEILYYQFNYQRIEVFIDDALYWWLDNGMPYQINAGVQSYLMQKVPPFQVGATMTLKTRLKDVQGNVSEFSPLITVIIPPIP